MPAHFGSRDTRLGYLAVVASAILFSAKSVFIKMCYAYGIGAMPLMALRMGFSLPLFLITANLPAWMGKAGAQAPLTRKDFFTLFGLGLLGYYLASAFDMLGLQYVSAGMERMVLYVYPSLVVLLSAWIFRQRVQRSMVLPLVLSYAGIALSFSTEASGGNSAEIAKGGALILLSALCYALFLIGHGRMVARIGPQRMSAYCMAASGVAVSVQFLISGRVKDMIQPLPVYGLALLIAVFSTVLPVYLFSYGMRAVGPGRTAVVSSVGPVSTYVLAAYLVREKVGWAQISGLILVLLGSLALGLKNSSKKVVLVANAVKV